MWGRGSGPPGGMSPEAQALRQKQIATLRASVSGHVTEIQKDCIYETSVQCQNGITVYVRITLPADFPNRVPVFQVRPPLRQRWVDTQMYVVGHEKIRNWNPHISLGKMVSEILRDFIDHPPQLIGPSERSSMHGTGSDRSSRASLHNYGLPHSNSMPIPPAYGSNGSLGTQEMPARSPRTSSSNMEAPTVIEPPEVPKSFPELEVLSFDELNELLNSEEEFSNFFRKGEIVKNLGNVKDELQANNMELARKNLEREQELNASKSLLLEKNTELQALLSALMEKHQNQQSLSNMHTPARVVDNLKISVQEKDEESEDLASRLMDGDIEVDEFVKQFIGLRKLYHLRQSKLEKIQRSLGGLSA
eukprot:Nk52_evm11s2462 gene=Nk52_evmTU11s2462